MQQQAFTAVSKLLSRVSVLVVALGFVLGSPLSIASAPTASAQVTSPLATSTPPVIEDALACNCYAYVRSLIPSLPLANLIKSNTTPHIGAVAVFDYEGLPHYGIITKLTADGFYLEDSNFVHCKYTTHFIAWSNVHIIGFWAT